jgi:general secretion pathway protein D
MTGLCAALAGAPASAAPPPAAKPPAGGRAQELTGDETGVLPFNTCKKQPANAKFTITLPKEAELQDLVNWMMSISCQKFIWDPKVRSTKITVLSPEPVTVQEAYAAFYASLEQMGLTVEPSGDYFKIVETADAKSKNLPVYNPGARAPNNDRYVTQLYRVVGGNTKDISEVLGKLKTKSGSVDTVGDLIILTDTGSSVQRLMQIVRQVDDPSVIGEKIFFYQLRYASAEEVADIIREIFGEKDSGGKKGSRRAGGGGGGGGDSRFSRVIVDERTGTLVIVAQESEYLVIRRLVEQLDVPLAGVGTGRLHVVKLRNANPQEVAQVLQQLATGAASRQGAKQSGGAPAPAPPPTEGGTPAVLFTGDIKVTADPATRSVVILASQSDFLSLQPVIKQIYIEVYLLELIIGRVLDAGAAAHFGAPVPTSQGQGLGFVASAPSPGLNSVLPGPDILSGIVGGVLGPEVPGSGQFLGLGRDIPAFGVIIQALQNHNDVNMVAEPHLFTADNKQASIEVGRNVPTPGALQGGGLQGGGIVPFQSIQRENVTLKVTITPHVNDERTVTLDVEMEDRDIESIDPKWGVTTTQRRLKLEQIVARDDQPLVLGGLVRETERESAAQVPGLGSIPLLGWLFKKKRKERVRTNLMMVLVPHILDSPDEARRIHSRRAQERLDFMEQQSSFKRRELATNVNYRNKRGVLAAMNAEAQRMSEEATRFKQIEQEMKRKMITGEIGFSPRVESSDEPAAPASSGLQAGGLAPAQPAPQRKEN